MEYCYVNHPTPLKKILNYYNKASYKGFEASLVNKSLEQLNLAFAARGNVPRPYEDYTLKEFDQSWRMEMLAGHLKEAIDNNLEFNHIQLGEIQTQLGKLGYKDQVLIKKTF
jgi:hypothetical protein